jgi:hypothetical protein
MGRGLIGAASAYALGLSVRYFLEYGWKPHRVETAWIVFAVLFVAGLVIRLRSPDAAARADTPIAIEDRLLIGAVAVLAAAAWSRALGVGLLSDDFVLVERAPGEFGWTHGSAHFLRALPVGLFRLASWASPWTGLLLHGTTLALHAVNGWLTWTISRRLGWDRTAATITAGLFLLFPASAEAVVWCSGLQDVVMTSAALAYVRAALDARHSALLIVCLLVGLLSKETAVAIPVLAVIVLAARGGATQGSVKTTVGVSLVVAAGFIAWRLAVGVGEHAAEPSRYLLKKIGASAFATLAMPWMTTEIARVPAGGIAIALLLVTGALLLLGSPHLRRATPAALGALCWVIIGMAPVYGMFFVSNTLEGSRYLYLPSIGWMWLLTAPVLRPASRLAAVYRYALLALLGVWAFAAHSHVAIWESAGRERDRIVDAALRTDRTGCTSPAFLGATDNVLGAYVFRNGLPHALRAAGLEEAAVDAAHADCLFSWSGETFERQP